MSFHVLEDRRILNGPLASDASGGNNGAFVLPGSMAKRRAGLFIIASDGKGWEHVSVSVCGEKRCPTWEEMCRVKESFWDAGDCVMQLHPPQSEYVNDHPFCLHLWRPVHGKIPQPDSSLVGISRK